VTWLRIVVSLSILAVLAIVIDVRETLALLATASPPLLPLLVLVNTGVYFLLALRWRHFGRKLEFTQPFRHYLRGIYLFYVSCQFMPSLLGEAARFAIFPRDTSKASILKSIALDRLASQTSLVVLVTALVPWYWSRDYPAWFKGLLPAPALGLVALAGAAWLLHRRRPFPERPWLGKIAFLEHLVADRLGLVHLAIGTALALALGLEFCLAVAALPVSAAVAPLDLILLVPLLSLAVALLPISFADWGTREAVALLVLTPTGLSPEDIVAVSLLVGTANLVCCLPGLFWLHRAPGEPENTASEFDTP